MPEDQDFGLVAGRYRLRDKLGHGGMGRVWLAYDEMLGRDVAIKEVTPPPHLLNEDDAHLRAVILREAKTAGRINHANVVKIHDVIETEGWPWLVMEYVPSVNLHRDIDECGPLKPAEAARVGLALLEALVAAHEAGVVHRDVKPANVLLGHDGRVVLGDFGLASLDGDGKVSIAGALGTPQFLAPERARHGISNQQTDLWSLGATLYAAVEGRSPYERDSMLETLSALAMDEPDPMVLAGPLEPVLTGLLRRDPSTRTDPALLAQQLRKVAAGQAVPKPVTAKVVAAVGPAGRRQALLAGIGALAVLATAGFAYSTKDLAGAGTPFAALPSDRPAVAIGIPGCEIPRVGLASPLPLPPPDGGMGLPDGWVRHSDPAGFSAAVPPGRVGWRLPNNTLCFRDPDGRRIMGIAPFRPKAESLTGYREIGQNEVWLRERVVEWEFTYTLRDRKRHAIAIVTSGPTLFWITDEDDFAACRDQYELARARFEAGSGRAG